MLCDLVPDELAATCDPYCAVCGRGDHGRMSRESHISLILEDDEPYVWDDPIEAELEVLHDQIFED